MNTHRILLLSNVRPSRVWKIVDRLSRDLSGAEICGIVQRPTRKLPLAQQLIATGRLDPGSLPNGVVSRASSWLRSALRTLVHSVLWWGHGCPPALLNGTPSPVEDLLQECQRAEYPCLFADDFNGMEILNFVRQQKPTLAIALGEISLTQELVQIPSQGWINAYHSAIQHAVDREEGLEIKIEHLGRATQGPFTVACVQLPAQPYDSSTVVTLKADLIADDLLAQTLMHLPTEGAACAQEAVTTWAQKILAPCLRQLQQANGPAQQSPQIFRHRATWKLLFETLMLFSPFIAGRNWYRRLRGRCPVTILTHHLVSDRPHRMGISTETFWNLVRFLLKHYRIVSLAEGMRLLDSGDLKAPTVVLTFDDGYADNFVSLRAVAEELRIPLVLFIATDPIETQQEFEHDLAIGIKGALPLTWEQIKYWGLRGAELGSHTRTHFDCGSTDCARLNEEITGSKNDLEAHIGMPVDSFAFPFGGHENMSSEAVEIASISHRYFLSSVGGENFPATGNGHLLRKGFYANLWELELDIQGVFELLESAKRSLHRLARRSKATDKRFANTARATAASSYLSSPDPTRSTTGIPASSLDISGV